jgi:hypothetical protein
MKRLACYLVPLLMTGTAHAASYYHSVDALENLRLAYDRNNPEDKAIYFQGYVAGVADSTHGTAWCPPSSISAVRAYDIVSKYMKAHLPTANQDAAGIVTMALGASFPCPVK